MKNLKQGDIIYYVENLKVRHCRYLCVHPTGQGKYHILIDECEEPFRVYEKNLLSYIEQGCKSLKEAKIALALKFEEKAKSYRE
jgi:hypothetical protein